MEYTPEQIEMLEWDAMFPPVSDAEYDATMSAIYDNYEPINTQTDRADNRPPTSNDVWQVSRVHSRDFT